MATEHEKVLDRERSRNLSDLASEVEPAIIREFRERAAFGKGAIIVGSCKGLGVRGELLCVNGHGESVYRLSPAQVSKVLKLWDANV
jgi:hypothetical protein